MAPLNEAMDAKLQQAVDDAARCADISGWSRNDTGFLQRVFKSGLAPYRSRIADLNLRGFESVLDAGCGFGQWSLALSEYNDHVTAVDASVGRIKFLEAVARQEAPNLRAVVGSIQQLAFADDSFDCIFCYSVIYLTDVSKTLKELVRVLRTGGVLYLVTNGPGWYLKSLIEPRHSTDGYDPVEIAQRAIRRAVDASFGVPSPDGGHQMLTQAAIEVLLTRSGLDIEHLGSEGSLTMRAAQATWNPYPNEFHGLEFVNEAYARKVT